MVDVSTFKKGFFLGRLIWIKGVLRSESEGVARGLVAPCNIQPGELWFLNPDQFCELLAGSLDRLTLERYEVMVLRDFEFLGGKKAAKFLDAIGKFREIQMGLGMRLVLVSDSEVSPEIEKIRDLDPILLEPSTPGSGPGELNDRVHLLVEQASEEARIPIRRISEEVADFLEDQVTSGNFQGLLPLLVAGIRRSDGSTLRFRDLLPNFTPYFALRAQVENRCNYS